MSYERWAKRMDDAVESSWLRGLRSSERAPRSAPRHRFVPNPPAGKKSMAGRRAVPAGADR